MAAVLEKKDPAKAGSQVDEQIAQATSRIRAHDLMFGGLALVVLVLLYAVAMIVLDKALVLPEGVRQAGLFGLLAGAAGVAYLTILRPLRKRINPLYAARQVEQTVLDAKNSVTGYVDAQERGDLSPTVKAALANRAAKAAAEADVNRAVNHVSLAVLGGVAVAVLLTLVVLFFVFRPAQFGSLVGRAFVPFSSDPIATRTQLTLTKPDPAEQTITTGQTVTVAVHVGGKVPSENAPDRVRLLIRHNPADPNYEELPMKPGDSSRDWEVRVPEYMVQNGFWYKVAGGDDVTDEHKVSVRSLPIFTDFTATYEYPKYLRRKTETANDPVITGYRGTTVTLVARTNRDVRDGLMVIEPDKINVPGTPVASRPDSLQFQFKLTESGKYRLTFNASNGERSADAFTADIRVHADQAPALIITRPEEDATSAPANGQLAVDGKVGDDFGIDTVTLKMRIVSPVERPLPDVPYLNGKSPSFRREDDTWPTDLDYKGSVDLAKLKKDAAGVALELTPDMVIEYWLEAADNCTEPKPNVGTSKPKRVQLTPPKVAEPEKKDLDEQKDARQKEEAKHNERQKDKLDKENRDPPPKNGEPKKDEKTEKKDDAKPGDKGDEKTAPKPGDKGKGGDPNSDPKTPPEPKKGGDAGMGGMNQTDSKTPSDPKKPNDPAMPSDMTPNPMGMGNQPEQAPMPSTPEQKNLDKTAEDLKKELDQQNQSPGAAKPNNAASDQERTPPADQKPQPMGGMDAMKDAAQPKPEPKPSDPMDPMGKGDASASKPQGDVKQTPNSEAKPEPKQGDPMGGKGGTPPAEKRDEPFGAPSGTEKPEPKEPQPAPKDPKAKQDPNSGSAAKPQKPQDADPSGMAGMGDPKDPKNDPAAGAGTKSKPMPEQDRGTEKPAGTPPESKPKGDPNAGEAKPDKTPQAGAGKPMPEDEPMPKGGEPSEAKPTAGANDMTKPNATGAAETKPDDGKKPPMGAQAVEKGIEKPEPKQGDKGDTASAGDKGSKPKLDEKQAKELADAAKDLTSPDEKKRDAARDKLDKAVGQEKRKELEKLANDLKSPDPDTRAKAEQKLKDMMDKATADKGPDKGDAPKLDEKQKRELADAAKNLNNPDPEKRKQAEQKLDKAIGEEQRKELQKLAKDLDSPDQKTKGDAQKKLDEMLKNATAGKEPDKTDGAPKIDEKQKQEIADALKDLQNPDPKKQDEARKKLDKMVGEKQRKEMEQLMDDLNSKDKEKQAAAQKKLDDLKNQMAKKDGKGKEELTKEQIEELAKKAQDLNSKDDAKRRQAEKDLDEKIGKENRDKLQEALKNQKPGDPKMDPEELKKQLDRMAKSQGKKSDDWQPKGMATNPPAAGPMDDDPKNRLRTAELQLEEFEKNRYNKELQAKKGWTQDEYDRFLEGYRKRVEDLRNEVERADKPATAGPGDPGGEIGLGGARKLDGKGKETTAGVTGAPVEPPGFEGSRDRFKDALKKKP